MKNIFIYKISNNYDWFLITNSVPMHYPCIMYYESFKDSILDDLNNFPSEEDFKIFSSSISAKEKLVHYINNFCEFNGCFLMNEDNDVFYLETEQIDDFASELLLNKEETDAFLNDLIIQLDLETVFKEKQMYYSEHSDEILCAIEEFKQYLNNNNLQAIYKEDMQIVKM